jgi:transcriptional regulator with XRE-family HTH domain
MSEGQPGGSGFGAVLRTQRRSRQLSQLALAERAGTSQRHLSFLESGRSQPSRTMVLQLADAMDLSLGERNRLMLAGGYAAVYPQRALESVEMQPMRQALERMLRHHEPFPAIVVNRSWDLLLVNDAVLRLFAFVGAVDEVWNRVCPDGRRNVLKMMLHPDGLRAFVRNFDEVARTLLARLQREAADSAGAAETLDELLRDAGLKRRFQMTDAPVMPSPVFVTELHANNVTLRLFAMISTFGTPQDVTADELRVGSFFPVDAASETFLRELAKAGG